jgi:hypothetical protein
MPRRTRSAVVVHRAGTAAVALLAGTLLAGCGGGDAAPPGPPKPTPLASYDGTVAHVRRISFCSRIPDAAVADAVGTKATTAHYGNGEHLPGSEDVSHEYGCVFNGADHVARSWVFVPPVTPARAGELAAAARAMPGCTEVPAAKFGSPAVGTLCHGGGQTTVTYRGLFGDAWLACSLAAPTAADQAAGAAATADQELVTKAGTWCVQVATTASAS